MPIPINDIFFKKTLTNKGNQLKNLIQLGTVIKVKVAICKEKCPCHNQIEQKMGQLQHKNIKGSPVKHLLGEHPEKLTLLRVPF